MKGWFSQKKAKQPERYDQTALIPVIRSSICTGEKVAGFQEIAGGRFREVMLIQSEKDLALFRKRFGISGEIKTIY